MECFDDVRIRTDSYKMNDLTNFRDLQAGSVITKKSLELNESRLQAVSRTQGQQVEDG